MTLKSNGGMPEFLNIQHDFNETNLFDLAFSMVLPNKKLWFAFNETTCELESYINEGDFILKKHKLSKIDLARCAILSVNSAKYEFKIL